ncbi:MAG: hypothetical protein GY794_20375 [bacterium]|nr:hypothetical protein [bacterium]
MTDSKQHVFEPSANRYRVVCITPMLLFVLAISVMGYIANLASLRGIPVLGLSHIFLQAIVLLSVLRIVWLPAPIDHHTITITETVVTGYGPYDDLPGAKQTTIELADLDRERMMNPGFMDRVFGRIIWSKDGRCITMRFRVYAPKDRASVLAALGVGSDLET